MKGKTNKDNKKRFSKYLINYFNYVAFDFKGFPELGTKNWRYATVCRYKIL